MSNYIYITLKDKINCLWLIISINGWSKQTGSRKKGSATKFSTSSGLVVEERTRLKKSCRCGKEKRKIAYKSHCQEKLTWSWAHKYFIIICCIAPPYHNNSLSHRINKEKKLMYVGMHIYLYVHVLITKRVKSGNENHATYSHSRDPHIAQDCPYLTTINPM